MSKIYTLRKAVTGDSAILNGKLIRGIIDIPKSEISFINALDNLVLIKIKFNKCSKDSSGIILYTDDIIYDLIDVETIIPTAEISSKNIDEEKINNFTSKSFDINDIRRCSIDKYEFDTNFYDIIYDLKSKYNISNIGELERAFIHGRFNNERDNIYNEIINIIKSAGFKKIHDNDIKFEGFNNFINTKYCTVIGYRYSIRHANYCDAWSTHEFVFKQGSNVTLKQFKEFCNINNLKIVEQGAWYQSYSELKNSFSNTWMYKWIDPYTD